MCQLPLPVIQSELGVNDFSGCLRAGVCLGGTFLYSDFLRVSECGQSCVLGHCFVLQHYFFRALATHSHNALISSAALPLGSNSVTARPVEMARENGVLCPGAEGQTGNPCRSSTFLASLYSGERWLQPFNTNAVLTPAAFATCTLDVMAARSKADGRQGITSRYTELETISMA